MGRKPKPVDMSTLSGVLAAKIRELRESKGLSIEEFAVLISEHNNSGRNNPSDWAVRSWEQNKGMPHVDLFPAIAKSLGLRSVRDLFPK